MGASATSLMIELCNVEATRNMLTNMNPLCIGERVGVVIFASPFADQMGCTHHRKHLLASTLTAYRPIETHVA